MPPTLPLSNHFVHLRRCTDVEGIKASGLDLPAFIRTGVVSGLRQLLEFGLFHGDPHPGGQEECASSCSEIELLLPHAPAAELLGQAWSVHHLLPFHPPPSSRAGNIFALQDGRIAYVDFGNVAELSQRNKEVRSC